MDFQSVFDNDSTPSVFGKIIVSWSVFGKKIKTLLGHFIVIVRNVFSIKKMFLKKN